MKQKIPLRPLANTASFSLRLVSLQPADLSFCKCLYAWLGHFMQKREPEPCRLFFLPMTKEAYLTGAYSLYSFWFLAGLAFPLKEELWGL